MTEQQEAAMRQALEFIERTSTYLPTTFDNEGLAIHAALTAALEQPAYRAVKTWHDGKPVYVTEQPAQQLNNCRHCGGADTVICAGQCKQPAQQELEQDEHAPDCSHDEFLLRGILASELKCWHRLTEDEAQNLVAFVRNMPFKAAPQEPVAVHQFRTPGCSDWYDGVPYQHEPGQHEVRTLYTRPQAREPLPDEEIERIFTENSGYGRSNFRSFARAIEAAHQIGEKK